MIRQLADNLLNCISKFWGILSTASRRTTHNTNSVSDLSNQKSAIYNPAFRNLQSKIPNPVICNQTSSSTTSTYNAVNLPKPHNQFRLRHEVLWLRDWMCYLRLLRLCWVYFRTTNNYRETFRELYLA